MWNPSVQRIQLEGGRNLIYKSQYVSSDVQIPPCTEQDYIRLGIFTPEQGAAYLVRPCTCGAFNPSRATELLEKAQTKGGG